jgi:hypothetical protein
MRRSAMPNFGPPVFSSESDDEIAKWAMRYWGQCVVHRDAVVVPLVSALNGLVAAVVHINRAGKPVTRHCEPYNGEEPEVRVYRRFVDESFELLKRRRLS